MLFFKPPIPFELGAKTGAVFVLSNGAWAIAYDSIRRGGGRGEAVGKGEGRRRVENEVEVRVGREQDQGRVGGECGVAASASRETETGETKTEEMRGWL